MGKLPGKEYYNWKRIVARLSGSTLIAIALCGTFYLITIYHAWYEIFEGIVVPVLAIVGLFGFGFFIAWIQQNW